MTVYLRIERGAGKAKFFKIKDSTLELGLDKRGALCDANCSEPLITVKASRESSEVKIKAQKFTIDNKSLNIGDTLPVNNNLLIIKEDYRFSFFCSSELAKRLAKISVKDCLKQLRCADITKQHRLSWKIANLTESALLLENAPNLIGSNERADIQIKLPKICANHCKIDIHRCNTDELRTSVTPLDGRVSIDNSLLSGPASLYRTNSFTLETLGLKLTLNF